QHAGTEDDVEGIILYREIEYIHQRKGGSLQPVANLVLQRKAEARPRQINSQDMVVVQGKKLRHLAGAAAAFENELVVTDGVEQAARKAILLTAVDQFAVFLDAFIARKRILLVERLDLSGHPLVVVLVDAFQQR